MYQFETSNNECVIYLKGKRLGRVWIDHTGAWNPEYEPAVMWLPINDALIKLGYLVKE